MLKHRLLTVLVLIVLILLAIWFLPMPWFAVLIGIVVAWGAWEWSTLAGLKNYYARGLYVILISAALWASYYLPVFWILMASLIIWLWVAAAILCYAFDLAPLGFQYSFTKIIVGFFTLVPAWLAVIALREDIGGPGWLLFGFMLIWAMDSGAYVAGRLWGKHTLISRVSPKKTWEGLWGGVISALLIAIIAALISELSLYRVFLFCVLALITVIFAIFGDLFESLLKRQSGVKDSGQLLPGHGGILDRIDSILAALPIFALCSLWTTFLGV